MRFTADLSSAWDQGSQLAIPGVKRRRLAGITESLGGGQRRKNVIR